MRRVVWSLLALAAAAVLLIAAGPALFSPTGKRLAIVELPRDYGLDAEDLVFRPPDRALASVAAQRGAKTDPGE